MVDPVHLRIHLDGPPLSEPTPQRSPTGWSRRRRLFAAVGIVLLAFLVFDLTRAPEQQLSARALLTSIDAYQATLSPALAATGARCRFEPSCSRYAEGALQKDGALLGSLRAVGRVLRCGPWTPKGTHDPP